MDITMTLYLPRKDYIFFFFFQTRSHQRLLEEIFLYKQMFSEIKKFLLCFVASFEVTEFTFVSPMYIIFALYDLCEMD